MPRKRLRPITLTAKRARAVLAYDPDTGILRWRVTLSNSRKAGMIAGGIDANGYVTVKIDGEHYKAHCVIWLMVKGRWPTRWLDHHDTLRSNNRWKNLRLATPTQNTANANMRSDNVSGVKGVHFKPNNNKWQAGIVFGGKFHYLGLFETLAEAATVRAAAAKRFFGNYAREIALI